MIGKDSLQFAKALFKTSVKNEALEEVLGNLKSLVQFLKDEQVQRLIEKVSTLDAASLNEIVSQAFHESLHEITLHLMIYLIKARKIHLLPSIAHAYRDLYLKEKGISKITLITAKSLSLEEQQEYTKILKEKSGKPLYIEFKENPDLIGGIQIFEQSTLTDSSIRHYLDILKKKLLQQNFS